MNKKIKIETDLETLDLVRKAISEYIDILDEYNDEFHKNEYKKALILYGELASLTFGNE